jgi:UDP-GlcNAc:undecaprenyl-phosphate GlcNAc-1-phosphate transferase
MYYIGFRVEFLTNPLGKDFMLGWISLPATIFWYLAVLNAINLIDGLDGLATGIAVIVCAVLLVVGLREHNLQVLLLSSLLLAGTSAFLVYNFHPARIFLGDTGALFIGLNIAAISTAGAEQFKGNHLDHFDDPLGGVSGPTDRLCAGRISQDRDGQHLHKRQTSHPTYHAGLRASQKAISIIVYIVTLLFG